MKVRTLIEFECIPEGSYIQSVEEVGDNYRGLWCSYLGSWEVEVPKELCEVL